VDIVHLQLALTSLVEWANEWQLAISIEKCFVLNIGKQVPTPHLHLDNCILLVVPLIRDLGVLVSSNLCPSAHVNDMIAKAHKRAYMIHRAYVTLILFVHTLFMSGLWWNIIELFARLIP